MADARDASLLERLNALKDTGFSVDHSANASALAGGAKEDALSRRLRSLRNRNDASAKSGRPPVSCGAAVGTHPQPPPTSSRAAAAAQRPDITSHRRADQVDSPSQNDQAARSDPDTHNDDLLDDLLDDILSIEVPIGEGHSSVSEDEDSSAGHDEHEEKDTKRAHELLTELLSMNPGTQPAAASGKSARRTRDSDCGGPFPSSEQDQSRQAQDVLHQAIDELDLAVELSHPLKTLDSEPGPFPLGMEADLEEGQEEKEEEEGEEEQKEEEEEKNEEEKNKEEEENKEEEAVVPQENLCQAQERKISSRRSRSPAVLVLPTVPTALVHPAVPPATAGNVASRDDHLFELSIASRLAALVGGLTIIATDALALPSAPTFQPEVRGKTAMSLGSRGRRHGYTDEDEKTWCIVCLEGATVRCLGCDDDVYCARCWKEMHVGPAAGNDERVHVWQKFDSQTPLWTH